MRNKFVVSALVVFGLLAGIVAPASGLWLRFGDSSVRLSTPIVDGVRASCTDGFTYRVAYKPNDTEAAVAGDPTGLTPGEGFPASFRVYDYADVRNADGSPRAGLTQDFSTTPSRWLEGGIPVPDFGTFTASLSYAATFFDSDPGDPDNQVVAALTEGSFNFPSDLPVGTGISIEGATLEGARALEVVEDCNSKPPVAAPEVNIFPFAKNYGIISFKFPKVGVAVINDGSFDPKAVDNLRFGPDGTSPRWTWRLDIDRDGDKDVVAIFKRSRTGIGCDDTSATLTGTIDGVPFSVDSPIQTRGCR